MDKISTERLFRHMQLEQVSAAQLAEKVGLSRQGIYNIVNGKSQPKPETLEKICRALNCSQSSLRGPNYLTEDCSGEERFACVLVERRKREGRSYDVEAATLENTRNWFFSHYSDLDGELFEEAREEAERVGRDFAHDLGEMLRSMERCYIREETQETAAKEALTLHFEVLSSMIDTVLPSDPDFDLFEGLEDER